MRFPGSLLCGAVGAVVLNALHEAARKTTPRAPHVDIVGMRAIGRPLKRIGMAPQSVGGLRKLTLAGDLVSNSFYFSAAAQGDRRIFRALALGAAAGLGTVAIPPAVGLGDEASRHSASTSMMTVGWYVAGALAAAGLSLLLDQRESRGGFGGGAGAAKLRLVERPTYV